SVSAEHINNYSLKDSQTRKGPTRRGNKISAFQHSMIVEGMCDNCRALIETPIRGETMLIKNPDDIKSSEITEERLFWNRRTFIRGAALATTATATGLLYRRLATPNQQPAKTDVAQADPASGYLTPSGEKATAFEDITNYNNFYEFSTSKEGVAPRAKNFVSRPWTVEVGGMVHKPKTFGIDDLIKLAPLEDRVYRFRCVEAWSMIIPWLGFPLKRLLHGVEP